MTARGRAYLARGARSAGLGGCMIAIKLLHEMGALSGLTLDLSATAATAATRPPAAPADASSGKCLLFVAAASKPEWPTHTGD